MTSIINISKNYPLKLSRSISIYKINYSLNLLNKVRNLKESINICGKNSNEIDKWPILVNYKIDKTEIYYISLDGIVKNICVENDLFEFLLSVINWTKKNIYLL